MVGPTNDFGEIYTVVDNDDNARQRRQRAPGSTAAARCSHAGGRARSGLRQHRTYRRRRLQSRAHPDRRRQRRAGRASSSPDVNSGAQLADVTGVVNYNFGNYEVVATQAFTVDAGEHAGEGDDGAGRHRRPADGRELQRREPRSERSAPRASPPSRDEIINNLKSPDIIALQEIQDNDGPGNAAASTVKAANVTLQMLVDALNAGGSGRRRYAFIDNPFIGDDTNGGEPRRQHPHRLRLPHRPRRLRRRLAAHDRPRTAIAISDPAGNTDQQTNADNPFFDSRPPLVGDLRVQRRGSHHRQQPLHLEGRQRRAVSAPIEPPINARARCSARRRRRRSTTSSTTSSPSDADARSWWRATSTTSRSRSRWRCSAAKRRSPTTTCRQRSVRRHRHLHAGRHGRCCTICCETLPADEQYDYVFEGNAQTLDHLLVSGGLAGRRAVRRRPHQRRVRRPDQRPRSADRKPAHSGRAAATSPCSCCICPTARPACWPRRPRRTSRRWSTPSTTTLPTR